MRTSTDEDICDRVEGSLISFLLEKEFLKSLREICVMSEEWNDRGMDALGKYMNVMALYLPLKACVH